MSSHVSTISREPFRKRIPTRIDLRKDITRYDVDNIYPQRVEQIQFRSPITNTAVNITADFINGEGFENNGDFIVDETLNLSADDLLTLVSRDFSPFSGFSIHINFNGLGEITQLQFVKFKYCRFGIPNDNGTQHEIKVNINWEGDPNLLPQGVQAETFTFPIFNINELDILGAGANGQILYWTPENNIYPRASFDSVLDSAQLNGDIQAFELANMQNGFHGSSIFKWPGEFENEKERAEAKQSLQQMKGVHGGNSTMMVEMPLGTEDFNLLENLPANNNDRLFELTNRNVVERILQAFSLPGPLAGVFPPSGAIFNQNEIADAYVYYNNRVKNRRMILGRIFNKLGSMWEGGGVDFGLIKEQQFINTPINPVPIIEP